MGYDWKRPPMTLSTFVMWVLGKLVLTLYVFWWLWLAADYLASVAVAIWQDAQAQPLPQAEPVLIREPGWVLRDYKERMNSERGTGVVDRRVQGGVSGRVVRSSPSQRSFSWSG